MADRRVESIAHHIGATGLVSVEIVHGSVRVVGHDGDEARVIVRGSDGGDVTGIADVHREADELRVDVRGMSASGGLRGMLSREVPAIDLDVTMPSGGRLTVNGVSADLHVSGVHGDQRHRTVSGDLEAVSVEGRFTVQSVSGDVRVDGGSYSIEAVSTSGDVEIRAARLLATRLRSVSGHVELTGQFAVEASHRVETVSGDLRLTPLGGLTLFVRGLSTSIHSHLPQHSESRGGRRTVVVGDGRAQLDFRSMSGDVSLIDATSERGSDDPPVASPPPAPEPQAPQPPQPPQPPAPSPPVVPSPSEASPRTRPQDHLSILRALERGDIDVDDAARLLEENDDA